MILSIPLVYYLKKLMVIILLWKTKQHLVKTYFLKTQRIVVIKQYLLQETYIVGDESKTTTDLDKSAQNELFDQLDDTILDFSETNPFGDGSK